MDPWTLAPWISSIRKTHRANAFWVADRARDIGIAARLAEGNARKRRPHAFLEGRSFRRERQPGKIPLLSLEIAVERLHRLVEMRARLRAALARGKRHVLLVRKENGRKPRLRRGEPQPADGRLSRRQQQPEERTRPAHCWLALPRPGSG